MHFSAEPGTNKTGTTKVYQDTAPKLRVNIVSQSSKSFYVMNCHNRTVKKRFPQFFGFNWVVWWGAGGWVSFMLLKIKIVFCNLRLMCSEALLNTIYITPTRGIGGRS